MTILKTLAVGAGLLAAGPLLAQDAPAAPASAAPDLASTLPLDEAIRATSVAALQQTLYDLIALREAAHQEHWNSVGIEFYQLHDLLGEIYAAVDAEVDVVGERILALGASADGRPSAVAANAIVAEPPAEKVADVDVLAFLLGDWSTESKALYDRLDAVEEDLSTQDTLIDVSRLVDHQLYLLRAHLDAPGSAG